MALNRDKTILATFLFLLYFLVDLPVSIHQFVYFKWLLNGLLAITGLVWFLYEKDVRYPQLSMTFWSIFCALILFKFAQIFTSNISIISSTTLDKMTFIPIVLLGYNLFLKDKIKLDDILWGIFISTFIFLILAFVNVFHIGGFDRDQLAGNFGNINIAAEFLGLSLILQLSTLFTKQLQKSLKLFLYGLSLFTTLYVYLASSRSVLIALIISFSVLLFFKVTSKPRILKWLGSVSIISCFVIGLGLHLKADQNAQQTAWVPDLQKSVSTNTRYELLKATLQMIQHNPWGVGPGEFEFAIMPYLHKMMPEFNEYVIPHAPHNEYLRLLAEEGIPLTLMLCALVIVFLYERRKHIVSTLQQYPIIAAFFTFWIIQSAFQFPFTNGFSVLVFCLIFSFALFKICPIKNDKQGIIVPQKPTLLYACAYAALYVSVCTSEYLTLWQPNASEKSKLAYALNARNWYAGSNYTQALIAQQDYARAQDLLDAELKKRPHHFVAVRQLISVHLATNNTNDACRLMKKYDSYFANNSSYTAMRTSSCPSLIAQE
jgi:O-antigen ligase